MGGDGVRKDMKKRDPEWVPPVLAGHTQGSKQCFITTTTYLCVSGEMARWAKHSLCKHEDLTTDSQKPWKSWAQWCVSAAWRWWSGDETGGPGAHWPRLAQTLSSSSREKPSQENTLKTDWWQALASTWTHTHIFLRARAHTPTHTTTCTLYTYKNKNVKTW